MACKKITLNSKVVIQSQSLFCFLYIYTDMSFAAEYRNYGFVNFFQRFDLTIFKIK